jgi:hypothetical protein
VFNQQVAFALPKEEDTSISSNLKTNNVINHCKKHQTATYNEFQIVAWGTSGGRKEVNAKKKKKTKFH